MALLRRVDLLLNNDRTSGNVLLSSLSDSSAPTTPAWIEDDKFLLRLRFCDRPEAVGGSATPTALEDDNVIVVAGKKTRGTGARLFDAQNFTKVTAEGDVYYQAKLNLNHTALHNAWGTGESQMTVWVDVEVQAPDADDDEAEPDRITWQFPVTIVRQSYDGDDGVAELDDPTYPAAELIVLKQPANGGYRFKSDGAGGTVFQLKNGTTGKFHSIFVTGEDGAEVLVPGPGEV